MRILLLLVFTLFSNVSFAQQPTVNQKTFKSALEHYENGQFHQAIVLFKEDNSPVSQLFLAKSYFALGENSETEIISQRLVNLPDIEVQLEANYLLSLVLIGKKQFAKAINILSTALSSSKNYNYSIQSDIRELQLRVLEYLSYNQRIEAIRLVTDTSLRNKIILDYYSIYPSDEAIQLLEELKRIDSTVNIYDHIESVASEEIVINNQLLRGYPTGNIINIGVLLPSFEQSLNEKPVSRGLYNGLLISVDEFNRNNTERKIKLHYIDSDELVNNFRAGLQKAKEELNIDVIIGPLFSQQVEELSNFVDRLGIPFIAPLANTYDISSGQDYILQINPSFESRGRQTAKIAIDSLNLQKFGVMTEKGTHGETDATAFADEIIELGGEITYFFAEDFASTGYFVGDHTPYFANDQALVDTTLFVLDTLDAVYLPYTGEVAATLLNLTLTGLEQYNPQYVVLGNDEMMYIDHPRDRLRRLNIMYTSSSNIQEGTEEMINFRLDYLNRSGLEPNTFSYLGYDIGTYYLEAISQIANPDDFLLFLPYLDSFSGISTSINFGNDNSNDALKLFQLSVEGIKSIEID
jgi:tetratricopeptide (TPR) repeat protein